MSLENRLRKLEGDKRAPCPECRFNGDWSDYEVVWHYGEEEDEGPQETVYYFGVMRAF